MNFEPTIKDFTPDQMRYIASLVESTMTAAVLAEREACVKVCDELSTLWYDEGGSAKDCAAAIRARGE